LARSVEAEMRGARAWPISFPTADHPGDRAAATQIYRMKVATQVRNATGDMT